MKLIIYPILIALVITSTAWGKENLRVIRPERSYTPDLSLRAQQAWERGKSLLADVSAGKKDPESLTEEERNLLVMVEGKENIWQVSGEECSWYCGGGPEEISASSALAPSGQLTYEAGNAHDFDFGTAWVEGAAGNGIREFIEFRFPPLRPRVNEIQIFNGYLRTEKAWRDNARVKRFKLYVNRNPYAILELEDTRALQKFSIEPMRSEKEGEDLVLRFEILEVYPGARWQDAAITEIEFDGLDVHCFVAGTLVRTSEGTDCAIEELKAGDQVLSYNPRTAKVESAQILELAMEHHSHLVKLSFEGLDITSTTDHPYSVKDKGWCSADPARSRVYKGMETIGLLEPGDEILFLTDTGELDVRKLISIKKIEDPQETFTITRLSRNSAFFANGLLVAVEEVSR